MATERTPLVEQEDRDNRGLIQAADRPVEKPTPLPKLQLFSLFYIQFCEPITATVIYPFVVQLVRDTGITHGDEAKTGYFAGFIESAFFAAEALTVLQWGRLSDRIGRKPPLVFGTLGCAAAIALFGLSKNFWLLILCRCIQGVFNGNIGITKAVMSEITDVTNIARTFSLMPLVWGTGVTFGPVIGGVLSHPAERWPQTIGKIKFMHSHPYFLPCIVAAMVPLSAFVFTSIFFQETLASAIVRKKRKSEQKWSRPQTEHGNGPSVESEYSPPPLRSLMTRRVLLPIVNYAILAFIDQCCSVLMPLVFATSIPFGGLGLDSFTIGIIMSTLGIIIGFVSALLFPFMSKRIGVYRLYKMSFRCYFVIVAAFPIMNLLARRANGVDGPVWVTIAILMSSYVVASMNYSCVFMFFSDSAPTRSSLGAINGLAQTVACTMRIFAPLVASSLFSFTQQHNLLRGTFVYWILGLVVIAGIYMSTKLPNSAKSEDEE